MGEKSCIYCGKPVDTEMPHWFGAHFEGQLMPVWHLECDPAKPRPEKVKL